MAYVSAGVEVAAVAEADFVDIFRLGSNTRYVKCRRYGHISVRSVRRTKECFGCGTLGNKKRWWTKSHPLQVRASKKK